MTQNQALFETDAVLRRNFIQYIADGNYITTVCNAVGVTPQSYYRWVDKAEHGIEPYVTFISEVKEAAARAEMDRVREIKDAGATNWVASMTFLERRYPEKYGRQERTAVKEDNKIQVEIIGMNKEDVIREDKEKEAKEVELVGTKDTVETE